MTDKQPDHFDWFGALARSTDEARALHPAPKPTPAPCLCGSTDIRGRIIDQPVDLTDVPDDLVLQPHEGWHYCRACAHTISHREPAVHRYYGPSTTVRDHYHASCVQI